MSDILTLFEILASVALVAVPPILLGRLLSGGEGVSLADLFAVPVDAAWPRGVQEEDTIRWRVDLLGEPTSAGDLPHTESNLRPNRRRAAALGVETSACA